MLHSDPRKLAYGYEIWKIDNASRSEVVPHGISVIVNSPAVFRKTGPACAERHWKAAEAMGADLRDKKIEDSGDILADQIISMMRDTGIPNGLSGVGYSNDDLDALTEKSFPQKRLIDNGPITISREELKDIFPNACSDKEL